MAFADNGRQPSLAVNLGWTSISLGLAANILLVGFKIVRKTITTKVLVGGVGVKSISAAYSQIMNLHIVLNSVGFVFGLIHGLMLIRGLDFISLSLALIMTTSMASGFVLKYLSSNNAKFVSRLVHSQFILGVILVTLVLMHVIVMWR